MTDIEAAWDEIHDAKPDGWFVGPPTREEHRHEWTMYAFDTRERPKAGHRSRDWTAVAKSELEVVSEMARCLGLIGKGRVPDSERRRVSALLASCQSSTMASKSTLPAAHADNNRPYRPHFLD